MWFVPFVSLGVLPFLQLPVTTQRIEPAAERLLAENRATMKQLQRFSAECRTIRVYPASSQNPSGSTEYKMSFFTGIKPNKMRYENWEMSLDETTHKWKKARENPTDLCTGNATEIVDQYGIGFEKLPVKVWLLEASHCPWEGFFDETQSAPAKLDYLKRLKWLQELRVQGTEEVEGVPCTVIIARSREVKQNRTVEFESRYFIGYDKLIHRKCEVTRSGGRTLYSSDAVLHNIQTNFPDPTPSTFAYAAPPGVRPDSEVYRDSVQLLTDGTPAPDYTLLTRSGTPVKLSSYRGKVVVLDFWATWCGPCVRSMPHTNKVARQFKKDGVVVLAVDSWDDENAFQSFVKAFREYESLVFLRDSRSSEDGNMATRYNVRGIPTQYVIDGKGIVRRSVVGYLESKELEQAIMAALAITKPPSQKGMSRHDSPGHS